jgi:glycosyltransferase involved in cell wall biosynthesis
MKIAYLAQVFPHLTMTFVYREVMALRDLGLEIATFATRAPNAAALSAEAKALVAETTYVLPTTWQRLLRAHAGWLWRRPRRYLGTLAHCLRHSVTLHKGWRNGLHNGRRTLLHFGQAICLAEDVVQQEIDHLHVHFALNATTLAMIVARLTDITYSFTAHANDIFANPILLPQKIAAARFIVAISTYNADFLTEFAAQHGLNPHEVAAKIEVVRCGIDVTHFAPPPTRAPAPKPVILAVGRLVEKKGYPYLIDACKQLGDAGHRFDCIIVGDGPEADALAAQIARHKLEESVHLAGVVFQERLKEYLHKADIIVLPCVVAQDQDMDGIPNSLMEGMAMEIPAVSTTISGIPELIHNDQSGLLVPPNDAEALAEALARLLTDPALRRRLGKAGRAQVVADYAIDKNTRRLLEIFRARLSPDLGKDAAHPELAQPRPNAHPTLAPHEASHVS